jgi:predicted nucleic acid-binding protein
VKLRRALRVLRGRKESLSITHQNIVEFWAVATRPVAANGLGFSIEETIKAIKLLKKLFKVHPETPNIFAEWENLVIIYRVTGKSTHDARIVAAMKVHGLKNIITFNASDFKRFVDIAAIDPTTIK